jgi:parallel beta-helix repeat protein
MSISAKQLTKLAVLGAAVAGFMALGVGHAHAATVVCGQIIIQDTKVSNDLLDCPGDGLVIGAANIKLDLGGHLIDGDDMSFGGTDAGVDNTGGFDNVEIKHGAIQEFDQGVNLLGASDNEIHQLEVLNNRAGVVLGLGSDNNTVERNVVHDNPRPGGILADGTTGNTISRNTVYNNGSPGIGSAGIAVFNSTNAEVSLNDVFDNAMIGIWLFNADASLVKMNTVQSNGNYGIDSFSGSTGNLFLKNVSNENDADGIHIDDPGNTITRNEANLNFNLGIFAVAGNTDGGGNTASGNGDPAQCVGVVCS